MIEERRLDYGGTGPTVHNLADVHAMPKPLLHVHASSFARPLSVAVPACRRPASQAS